MDTLTTTKESVEEAHTWSTETTEGLSKMSDTVRTKIETIFRDLLAEMSIAQMVKEGPEQIAEYVADELSDLLTDAVNDVKAITETLAEVKERIDTVIVETEREAWLREVGAA